MAQFTEAYKAQRNAIMDDRAASTWLKTAICALDQRDPVDAISDVEVLLDLAQCRLDDTFRESVKVEQNALAYVNSQLAKGAR
jgi:hypothetical protein